MLKGWRSERVVVTGLSHPKTGMCLSIEVYKNVLFT